MITGIVAIWALLSGAGFFDHPQKNREVAQTSDVNPYLVKQIPSSSTGSRFWDLLSYGNSYIKVWLSNHNNINLNHKLKQPAGCALSGVGEIEEIHCRHLAFTFAISRPEDFYKILESRTDQSCSGILNDHELDHRFFGRCSKEAHYLKLKNLTMALDSIARDIWKLEEGAVKSFVCSTMGHMLAFRIKKEEDQLKVMYYDPNDTLRHKTFVMAHPDEISALTTGDFFDNPSLKKYFKSPAKEQEICLLSPEFTDHRDSCRVTAHGEIDNYWLPMRFGHYGHESLGLSLNAGLARGFNGLYVALYEGQSEAVRVFIQGVLDSTLDDSQKVGHLCLGCTEAAHTRILYTSFRSVQAARALEVYRELIVESKLSSESKHFLLQIR